MNQLPDVATLEVIVRDAASTHIMPFFGHAQRHYKADKSVVTEADFATQQYLQESLKANWPQYDFLAEEMTAEEQKQHLQNHEQGLWIVDPLDGTSNFAAGIPYFAISIALIIKGKVRLGLVYDPNRDEAFSATEHTPALLNGIEIPKVNAPEKLSQCIGVVDFKRLPGELAAKLATQQPFSSQRSFGSVALDWCWLAAHRFHVYLHGRSNIWDYAAGDLIFRQAGGYSCTLEGDQIFVADVTPRSAMAAMEEKHFESWKAFLK
jgi:myo-inositol-1(or 4)-monophosphatase